MNVTANKIHGMILWLAFALPRHEGMSNIKGRKISVLSKLRRELRIMLPSNKEWTGASHGNPLPLFKKKIIVNTIKPKTVSVFLRLLLGGLNRLNTNRANKEKQNVKKNAKLISLILTKPNSPVRNENTSNIVNDCEYNHSSIFLYWPVLISEMTLDINNGQVKMYIEKLITNTK